MQTDFREVVKGVALDVWICNHFKVLPTEDRFKYLTERQKYLLFIGFVEQPRHDDMHKAYAMSRRATINSSDGLNLKKLGYTDEQIRKMREQLEKAGS